MTSDEDGGDGGDIPDAVEPGPSTEPAISREPAAEEAPDFQGPTSTERSLRCDGDRWEMNLCGTWLCCGCESTEFYSCRRPPRHETDEGVWSTVPGEPDADGLSQWPPGPDDDGGASEFPESEAPTFDPVVEPDQFEDDAPPRPLRGPRRTTSCPAPPPTSAGPTSPPRPSTLPATTRRCHKRVRDLGSQKCPGRATLSLQLPRQGPGAQPHGRVEWAPSAGCDGEEVHHRPLRLGDMMLRTPGPTRSTPRRWHCGESRRRAT